MPSFDRILRIDMTKLTASAQVLPPEDLLLGGRGLTSQILLREVPPGCDPLGPQNVLVFAAGLLPDPRISSAGRLSVGTKSPLTGGIKEANAGGTLAYDLARLGFKAVVITGQPPTRRKYLLKIHAEGAEILPAEEMEGLGNYDLARKLCERYGQKVSIASIGPSGEYLMRGAGVAVTDAEGRPGRFAARGGVGAVMAAKGLKAIVTNRQPGRLAARDEERFKAAIQRYNQTLRENHITGYVRPEHGTASAVMTTNAIGALPTRNFRFGSFEQAADINSEALRSLINERGGKGRIRHACMPGCVMQCSNVVPDKTGEELVSPIEYETLCLLGSNLGIGSLHDIAELNWIANDVGVDTIEAGAALGVAMESGLMEFGDAEGCKQILREIGQGSILGRVIGNGAVVTGAVFGVTRVPQVKGQALPAYDPRGIKGIGVTLATSPMGADHTAGHTLAMKIDHHSASGQVEASRNVQMRRAGYDTFGLCSFIQAAFAQDSAPIVEMFNAVYGQDQPGSYLEETGRKVLQAELEFNRQAGFTRQHDRLPEFFRHEPLPGWGLVFDITDEELDETLKF